jgi:hypothetical protein
MPTGFTAVVCRSQGCADPGTVAPHLVDALRAAVRESPLGVLVSTGCLLGPSACCGRAAAPVVLVQRCDAERRPVAPAVRVGPVRTVADVEALVSWLRTGRLEPGELPGHLLAAHRLMAAAPRN